MRHASSSTLLQRELGHEREELLTRRHERAERLRAGELPDFLPETAAIRAGDWRVPPAPADLQDRRVEITGPVDAKMVINALNSGARVFMADFEDANSPTWENVIQGQANLSRAIDRDARVLRARRARSTALNDELATLLVRPRGWHLVERHFEVDGAPVSASLFDFGLYVFSEPRAARRGRHRAVLLPAEARVASRGGALERRLRASRRTRSASRAARSARPS